MHYKSNDLASPFSGAPPIRIVGRPTSMEVEFADGYKHVFEREHIRMSDGREFDPDTDAVQGIRIHPMTVTIFKTVGIHRLDVVGLN